MPIPFTCPHCGQETTVDDQSADRTSSCAACGRVIALPGSGDVPLVPYPARRRFPDVPPARISTSTKLRVTALVGGVLGIAMLIGMLYGGIRETQDQAQLESEKQALQDLIRAKCGNNMKQIGLTVHRHADMYGELPPVWGECKNRENSVDGWSWRVQLLPHLEEAPRAEKFHYDEPWDSEHNLSIAEYMPPLLQCPGDSPDFKEIKGHMIPVASYVMITGEFEQDTFDSGDLVNAFGQTDGRTIDFNDIPDGLFNTIMIVEVSGDDRPAWTEPVDITIEDLQRGVNTENGMSIGSRHPGGANVVLCDSSVHFIPDGIDPETLLLMASISDDEPIDWDFE